MATRALGYLEHPSQSYVADASAIIAGMRDLFRTTLERNRRAVPEHEPMFQPDDSTQAADVLPTQLANVAAEEAELSVAEEEAGPSVEEGAAPSVGDKRGGQSSGMRRRIAKKLDRLKKSLYYG